MSNERGSDSVELTSIVAEPVPDAVAGASASGDAVAHLEPVDGDAEDETGEAGALMPFLRPLTETPRRVLRAFQSAVYDRYGIVLNQEDVLSDEKRAQCLELAREQYSIVAQSEAVTTNALVEFRGRLGVFREKEEMLESQVALYRRQLSALENADTSAWSPERLAKAAATREQLTQVLENDLPPLMARIGTQIAEQAEQVRLLETRRVAMLEDQRGAEEIIHALDGAVPDEEELATTPLIGS